MNKDGREQKSKPFTPSVSTSIFSFLGSGRSSQAVDFYRKERKAGKNTFAVAKAQMERELLYIDRYSLEETTRTLNRTVKELIKHNDKAGLMAVLVNIDRLPDSSLGFVRTKMMLSGMPIKDWKGRYDKLSLEEASLLKLHLMLLEKINARLEKSDREELIQLNQSSLSPQPFKPYGTDYLKKFEEAMPKRSQGFSDAINVIATQLEQEINREMRVANQVAFLAGFHKKSGLESALQTFEKSPIGDKNPILDIFEFAGIGVTKPEIKSKSQPQSDSETDLDQEQDRTRLKF